MIVQHLMSREVTQVPACAQLQDVLTQMHSNKHSCALIVEDKQVQGIITERDLVRVFAEHVSDTATVCDVGHRNARELMTHPATTVQENSSLLDALVLSRSRKLRHLPVVNHLNELVGVVTHTDMVDAYVSLLERQGELESTNQQLQELSLEDPLLHIGNRRALEMELALLDAQSQRSYQPYSLVMIDVDWFKYYNDCYGHPMGDNALKSVVSAIKSGMRGTDRLYRYGGEELLLLTPNAIDKAALAVANRARQAVADIALEHSESPLDILTISAGTASGRGFDTATLIAAADKALYQAKSQGRNQACMAELADLAK